MKIILWSMLQNRLKNLINHVEMAHQTASDYLTVAGYQQVLEKALDKIKTNPPRNYHLPKGPKKNTPDRTAEIVFLNGEYQLILNPNNKLKTGEKDCEGTLAKGSIKVLKKAVRIDRDSDKAIIVAKITRKIKSDLHREIDDELKYNHELKHTNILTFSKGTSYKKRNFFKGTLYAPKADCTLERWVELNSQATYATRLSMLIDILEGLVSMHEKKIGHGDLDVRNIMVFNNKPKIIDFDKAFKNEDDDPFYRHIMVEDVNCFADVACEVLYGIEYIDFYNSIPSAQRIGAIDKTYRDMGEMKASDLLNALKQTQEEWKENGVANLTPPHFIDDWLEDSDDETPLKTPPSSSLKPL